MTTGAWIFIVILGVLAGAVGGFFLARRYMMNYFAENPPISEDMLRNMMMQMGQKPSERKVKQILASMKAQSAKNTKKNK
ncbi:YneF family protein [Jeotgalibaca caeni]|uniref:YneF family protein n=1 Tax=Jeotgalibaca caeni TaxID=3028623 RepID=UPI00237DD45E|nr:YneF family protein [Jeotgalibaca caeni]MDE1549887.1 YneF family protein [Jeotgalibaca caeni]